MVTELPNMYVQPDLACFLYHAAAEIPAELLEPSRGRLLIWRR